MKNSNCKLCGGNVVPIENMTYGSCDDCRKIITLSRTYNDQKTEMFNRGNVLRMDGEYDKAAAMFEWLLESDERDAEANWSLALCRYGVRYNEDQDTYEWMPACNRENSVPFLNDANYLTAIENSDDYTANLYIKEAKKIAEYQESMVQSTENEETAPADTVNIKKTELDRMLEKSGTLMNLGNYTDANGVFTHIIRDYPEDYRGWWGMITCETEGLKTVSGNISKLNEWYGYVSKIAGPELMSALEAEYVAYMEIIAEADAEKERDAINKVIKNINKKVTGLINDKVKTESDITLLNNAYLELISRARQELDSLKPKLMIRYICGGFLFVLGLIIAIASFAQFGVAGMFVAAIFGTGIGIAIISAGFKLLGNSKHPKLSDLKKRIKDIENKTGNSSYSMYNTEHLEKQLKKTNDDISLLEKEITDYNNYLAQGRNKITEICFAERCESFGVAKPHDSKTEKLRKAIYTEKLKNALAGISEIICPKCQNKFSIEKDKQTGKISCPNCWTTVTIN